VPLVTTAALAYPADVSFAPPKKKIRITKQFVYSLYETIRTAIMKQHIKPTESELEILNVLWADGPSTVRDVHDKLALTKDTGYTTTLKLMQIMLDKQILSRDSSGKTHIYTALINQQQAQGQMLQKVIETMFNGSAMKMVMQALGNHKASKAELDMIREYLDQKTKK
jgi:BlaI family penicillinase repressor